MRNRELGMMDPSILGCLKKLSAKRAICLRLDFTRFGTVRAPPVRVDEGRARGPAVGGAAWLQDGCTRRRAPPRAIAPRFQPPGQNTFPAERDGRSSPRFRPASGGPALRDTGRSPT